VKRLGLHLLPVSVALVMPFLIGWLNHTTRVQRTRDFTAEWGLELAMALLLIVTALLLFAPTWWRRLTNLRNPRVDWLVLVYYLLPGILLVLLPGVFWGGHFFSAVHNVLPIHLLADSAGYWGARLMGAMLIGIGPLHFIREGPTSMTAQH
jgi:hypothetical protein